MAGRSPAKILRGFWASDLGPLPRPGPAKAGNRHPVEEVVVPLSHVGAVDCADDAVAVPGDVLEE
eukprot:15452915-Alexandrium_andersonii.AAC.1